MVTRHTGSLLERKKQGNLIQFDSTPWPVVESQHLRLQWLQAIYWWSSRPRIVQRSPICLGFDRSLFEPAKKTLSQKQRTWQYKNYIMLYIYVHICIQIRNIFNPFRSISHICIPLKVYNVIKVFLHGFVVNFQINSMNFHAWYSICSISPKETGTENACRKHVAMRRTFFFLAARQWMPSTSSSFAAGRLML